jgi:hypothetical protein
MKRATMLAVAVTLSAATAAGADSLPIERGYYVRSDTPCQQASTATITLYNGVSFGHAHVECRKPAIRILADRSYQIAEQCRDTQGSGGRWTAFAAKYAVPSRTEVTSITPYQKAAYRYCKQSDLPEPWSTIDLSKYSVKQGPP